MFLVFPIRQSHSAFSGLLEVQRHSFYLIMWPSLKLKILLARESNTYGLVQWGSGCRDSRMLGSEGPTWTCGQKGTFGGIEFIWAQKFGTDISPTLGLICPLMYVLPFPFWVLCYLLKKEVKKERQFFSSFFSFLASFDHHPPISEPYTEYSISKVLFGSLAHFINL